MRKFSLFLAVLALSASAVFGQTLITSPLRFDSTAARDGSLTNIVAGSNLQKVKDITWTAARHFYIDGSGNLQLQDSSTLAAALSSAIAPAWGNVTGKPTTLSGYGITDAAPIASPTLTGTPLAPTAAADTSTTQIATTAYAKGEADAAQSASQPVNAKLTAISALTTTAASLGDIPPVRIVYDGDSITSASPGWTTYFAALPGWSEITHVNTAVSGTDIDAAIARYATTVRPYKPVGSEVVWYIADESVNSIYAGGDGLANYKKLKTLWALARADGFKVFACTLTHTVYPTGYDPTAMVQIAKDFNNYIRADHSLYDGLLEFDLVLTDSTDLTYFMVDQLHPNSTGHQLLAAYCDQMLRSHLNFTGSASRWTTSMIQQASQQVLLEGINGVISDNIVPVDLLKSKQVADGTSAFDSSYYGAYRIQSMTGSDYRAGLNFFFPRVTTSATIAWDTTTMVGAICEFSGGGGAVNAFTRFCIGSKVIHAPASRAIGWDQTHDGTNRTIRIVTHDGTTLTQGSWVTFTNGSIFQVAIFSLNGTVTLWVRRAAGTSWTSWTYIGSQAGGPTSNTSASQDCYFGNEQGATASGGTITADLKRIWFVFGSTVPPLSPLRP